MYFKYVFDDVEGVDVRSFSIKFKFLCLFEELSGV